MTQLLVVPSSMRNLVDQHGMASRQFQIFLSNLVSDLAAAQANVVPTGGSILWLNTSPDPSGWTDTGDTVVVGPKTYKILTK